MGEFMKIHCSKRCCLGIFRVSEASKNCCETPNIKRLALLEKRLFKALINYQLTVHFDPRCAEVLIKGMGKGRDLWFPQHGHSKFTQCFLWFHDIHLISFDGLDLGFKPRCLSTNSLRCWVPTTHLLGPGGPWCPGIQQHGCHL